MFGMMNRLHVGSWKGAKMNNPSGIVFIRGWRPFIEPKPIKRGKFRGQYWVTLTAGRRDDGQIRPGKKKRVAAKSVRFADGNQAPKQAELF